MSYVVKFGSYTLPGTFAATSVPSNASVPVSKLPKANGGRTSSRYLEQKVIRVTGGLARELGGGGSSLQTQVDALKAGLQGEQSLYLDTARYFRKAQLSDFTEESGLTSVERFNTIAMSFVVGDPFQYSDTLTSSNTNAISGSGYTKIVTPSGNAPSVPKISLTVGGSGAVTLSATITNNTTGKAFTLNGAVTGGDVIVIDHLEQTVTISSVDKTALFDGLFFDLAVGANTLQVDYTSGSFTNLAVEYRNRWY